MKNSKRCTKTPKKFNRYPYKQYVTKIRIYPSFLYWRLDKWLKSMSLKGWHIVHCGLFSFVFEKGKPREAEYFTYGLSANEGKYNICLRHPFLEKKYGLKNDKSPINSNKTKTYEIVEIDLNKIDAQNAIGYKELISDRNRLYMLHFIRNISILTSAILILVFLILLF